MNISLKCSVEKNILKKEKRVKHKYKPLISHIIRLKEM